MTSTWPRKLSTSSKDPLVGDKKTSTEARSPQLSGVKPGAPKGWLTRLKRLMVWLAKCMAFFVSVLFIVAVGLFLWMGSYIPSLATLQKVGHHQSLTIFDQNHKILATYGTVFGESVQSKTLPPHVIHAFLAIEDRRFFHHYGIDFVGLARAIWVNYCTKTYSQGASTITQQLAKYFLQQQKHFSYKDRSLKRKLCEALLSLWLERQFTKHQLLTMYLNRMYFGAGTYGIDGAARRYFNCRAHELSLYEAALIAGLLKAPSKYCPLGPREKAEQRAMRVLKSMLEARLITVTQYHHALKSKARCYTPPTNTVRYFCDWIAENIQDYGAFADEDLDIITTLRVDWQHEAHKQLLKIFAEQGKRWNAEEMALVCLDRTGAVLVMLGGQSYHHTQFNHATSALRQVGSTVKFFTYLTALQKGWQVDSLIDDTTFSLGSWKPSNYKYRPQGMVSLERAFAWSANAPAIRLMLQCGIENVKRNARLLGISEDWPTNLSLALGSGETTLLELTAAFACVWNKAQPVIPYGVLEIRNKKGKILYRYEPDESEEPLLNYSALNNLKTLMRGVVQYGTARRARIDSYDILGKTGTSQRYRDLWFVAGAKGLITGVWCGTNRAKGMNYQEGGSPSLHLWRAFMAYALPLQQDSIDDIEAEEDDEEKTQSSQDVDIEKTAIENTGVEKNPSQQSHTPEIAEDIEESQEKDDDNASESKNTQ